MGKLRLEPKLKPPVSDEQYAYYRGILGDAQAAYGGNNVYYDLDPGESPLKVRKSLLYVAEKEGMPIRVRSARGARSLVLKFESGKSSGAPSGRLSAGDARKKIIAVLTSAQGPLQKAEILDRTGISPATWNLRINELLEEGVVQRNGVGRQTAYSLA